MSETHFSGIERLLTIMQRLRDPQSGCPWDKDQTFATIAPYTLEEAYEVADAIEREDWQDLKSELGDLLFQVVFYAQMSKENGWYDFDAIAHTMAEKLERRHPHVFGEEVYQSHALLHTQWEARKAAEREQRAQQRQENTGAGSNIVSVLDDIPYALPALMRAQKIQKRAASVGFDWPNIDGVIDKLHEELGELKQAVASNDPTQITDELGDVLFSVVNLSRHLHVKAEEALRAANLKFVTRFQRMEQAAFAQGKALSDFSLEQLESLWQQAKQYGNTPN